MESGALIVDRYESLERKGNKETKTESRLMGKC